MLELCNLMRGMASGSCLKGLSSNPSLTIYQLCDLGNIPKLLSASVYFICEMGVIKTYQ